MRGTESHRRSSTRSSRRWGWGMQPRTWNRARANGVPCARPIEAGGAMSNLIARILLAMLMFPLAALAYLLVFLVLMEGVLGYGRFRDELGFMLAGLGTWGFMAAYWWALWRKTV